MAADPSAGRRERALGASSYAAAVGALRRLSFRLVEGDQPLILFDRAARTAYLATGAAFALTAVPFLFAAAGDVSASLGAPPSPAVGDLIGRGHDLATAGPLPLVPGPSVASPLWVWMIALVYAPIAWTGLPVAVAAKLIGWLLGLVAAMGLYTLAAMVGQSRWPGVLVLGLLVLDPALAFGRVSGGEAPLVLAVTILTALALLRRHLRLLSWLLAALVLSRPDGALFALVCLAALLVDQLWLRGRIVESAESVLQATGRVGLPAVGALLAWSLYGLIVWGAPLPPYSDSIEPNAGAVASALRLWNAVLSDHPSFGSGFVVLALAAAIWTAGALFSRWGPRAAFPVLLPWLFGLAVLIQGAPVASSLSYDTRRILEPGLAWLALSLAVGLAAAAEFIWHRSAARPELARLRPHRTLALVPLLLWLLTAGLGWVRGPVEYAWGAANVAEAPLAAGRWLAENVPSGARVGLAPGTGAARAEARQLAYPLSSHPTGGEWRGVREAAENQDLTHLIAYAGTPPASWPMARELFRTSVPRNVVLPSPVLGVYALDWSLPRLDAARPVLLRMDGYVVIDAVDVGDVTSETRHFYAATSRDLPVEAELGLTDGWVADDGRLHPLGRGTETFTLEARPGRDLLLAIRYDGLSRGVLQVELDGEAREWRLRECQATLCEDAIVLPGGQINTPRVRVGVSHGVAPGISSGRVATYHYWSIVRTIDR